MSSSEAENNLNLEKLEEISEARRDQTMTGSRKIEESSKSKKKEDEDLRRKKKTPVSNMYYTNMPNTRFAYLGGETVEKKCELPGSAGAAGTSSSSTRASSRTSSPSTAVQELLPPSEIRSLSPASLLTNGSNFCAQYRQCTADVTEREEDSVSRSTNVCGPITAFGLSQQKKMWEKIGKSGGSTETGHHSS